MSENLDKSIFHSFVFDSNDSGLMKKTADDALNRMINDRLNKTDLVFAFACPLRPPFH